MNVNGDLLVKGNMSFNGITKFDISKKSLGLSQDEKLMNLLNSWHAIPTQEDTKFNERLVWCLEHCQGKFRDIRHFDTRVWYFQNEHDAALFALKWV